MRNWQIRLVYSRNLGEGDDELAATLNEISQDLCEYSASVSGGSDGLTATLVVQAPDHGHAVDVADTAIRQAAGDHDIQPGDIVESHARTWD
jgi:hypothetical protein